MIKVLKHMPHIRMRLNNSGFSLTEMLVTTIIVVMLCGGVATGVAFAHRQYFASMVHSEAAVLGSSVSNVMRSELSYSEDIQRDSSGRVEFAGVSYADSGGSSEFWHMESRKDNSSSEYGEVFFVREDIMKPMLSSSAYSYGLGVRVVLSSNSDDKVHVVVAVSDDSGQVKYSDEFDVYPENCKVDAVDVLVSY